MSKHLQPTKYSPRAKELQWINFCIGGHDLFCGCDHPIEHFKDITKPWPPTKDAATSTETTGDPETDILDDVDLETLFAEKEDTEG